MIIFAPFLFSNDQKGAFICLTRDMRVIAGQFRGARLFSPKDRAIRPTSDRVREYIFSCLHEDIRGTRVADLYAGTGAMGIEALSRGAEKVVFVDASKNAITVLQRNLQKLDINAAVYRLPVEAFIKRRDTGGPFDFIFCDPPYAFDSFELIVSLIKENSLLRPGGFIIYESDARTNSSLYADFKIIRQKKLGETRVTFYQYENEKDSNLSGYV